MSALATSSALPLRNWKKTAALFIGMLGLAVAGYGLFIGWKRADPRPVFSWLICFSFWFSISIGMLLLVMIWHVFDAKWPIIIRRQLEHGIGSFKWLALIFVPLIALALWGGDQSSLLWKWMHPQTPLPGSDTVGTDPLYQAKDAYLNIPFFVIRTGVYLGLFCLIAYFLRKGSFAMDRDGDLKWRHLCRKTSAIGLPLVGIGLTFAAIDWFKSLEYHWFSTMYGVWFFSAAMRAALAFTAILCFYLSVRGPLKGLYQQPHRYELGCLSLTFTIFWAYIAFSQYFLIYNANIPEETFWYNIREQGPEGLNDWGWIGFALIAFHFLVPFLFLLWYRNKVNVLPLVFISIWILVFHLIELYWNLLPDKIAAETLLGYSIRPFRITLYDVAALVGIGGVWLGSFFHSATQAAPIPVRDPWIKESLHHHE